jgi:hypothetical protein
MQVRPVRIEESRAINGAQRPLHRHQPAEPPPSDSLTLAISLDRFSKAGKTILDPSMRTVH